MCESEADVAEGREGGNPLGRYCNKKFGSLTWGFHDGRQDFHEFWTMIIVLQYTHRNCVSCASTHMQAQRRSSLSSPLFLSLSPVNPQSLSNNPLIVQWQGEVDGVLLFMSCTIDFCTQKYMKLARRARRMFGDGTRCCVLVHGDIIIEGFDISYCKTIEKSKIVCSTV